MRNACAEHAQCAVIEKSLPYKHYGTARATTHGPYKLKSVVQYDGVSNVSYEYFDIKDKQKVRFLELVIVYVPVCLVSF